MRHKDVQHAVVLKDLKIAFNKTRPKRIGRCLGVGESIPVKLSGGSGVVGKPVLDYNQKQKEFLSDSTDLGQAQNNMGNRG